jgi:hypothetical protein
MRRLRSFGAIPDATWESGTPDGGNRAALRHAQVSRLRRELIQLMGAASACPGRRVTERPTSLWGRQNIATMRLCDQHCCAIGAHDDQQIPRRREQVYVR